MGDDEGLAKAMELVGQCGTAGRAKPVDAAVEPARPLHDVDRHDAGRWPRPAGSRSGAYRESVGQLARELTATGAHVDDHRRGTSVLLGPQGEQRLSEDSAGGCVGGRREVRGRPAARDVEAAPVGVEGLVPGFAPRKGSHASGL